MGNTVVVLDFGGQYTQVIARRIREAKVYCQVMDGNTPVSEMVGKVTGVPGAFVLSGGPNSVNSPNAIMPDSRLLETGVPVLGICYGMQVLAKMLGGKVISGKDGGAREYGPARLTVDLNKGLFRGLPEKLDVWMSHGDSVVAVPTGFSVLGRTETTDIAVMGDLHRKLFGVQFHPEVVHTPLGQRILDNFLFEIAGLKPEWTVEKFVDRAVSEIKETVGQSSVIAGVSGGVDSTVAAVLVHKAVGSRLHLILVDHGLMRLNEIPQVVAALKRLGLDVQPVDARDRFFSRLKGVTDPEQKRKIIGEEFIRVFEEETLKYSDAEYFVQGTIYPDVIESGSKIRAVIKSHHNVGGLPEKMRFKLVEPLKELFKDEVREVGRELGLAEEFVDRHPFPGPGLGVRVLGELTPEKVDIVRRAQAILDEEIRKAGLYSSLWQSFCVLTGVRTVGVMGDVRTYGNLVGIRAVNSDDAMTASWARLPYDLLDTVSSRIVNEIEEVNRVAYDITSKPPGTIEWE